MAITGQWVENRRRRAWIPAKTATVPSNKVITSDKSDHSEADVPRKPFMYSSHQFHVVDLGYVFCCQLSTNLS
jgi:hypothetical protein